MYTMWTDLQGILLSVKSQVQRADTVYFHAYNIFKMAHFIHLTIFFFFFGGPEACEVPGPGIEPEPQMQSEP